MKHILLMDKYEEVYDMLSTLISYHRKIVDVHGLSPEYYISHINYNGRKYFDFAYAQYYSQDGYMSLYLDKYRDFVYELCRILVYIKSTVSIPEARVYIIGNIWSAASCDQSCRDQNGDIQDFHKWQLLCGRSIGSVENAVKEVYDTYLAKKEMELMDREHAKIG